MSVRAALIIAISFTIFGIGILYSINPKSALFGAVSIFLYTSVYTPLKPVTPLCVFVGAIPGAIPFMLGWVAATNNFGMEAGFLFLIQFFWQFPHFWAIGWLQDEEYKKAGFNMLPMGKKDTWGGAPNYFVYCINDMCIYSSCTEINRCFLYIPSNSNFDIFTEALACCFMG